MPVSEEETQVGDQQAGRRRRHSSLSSGMYTYLVVCRRYRLNRETSRLYGVGTIGWAEQGPVSDKKNWRGTALSK